MTIAVIAGADFERNPKDARKAAEQGPVVIADSGRPAHVLLTFDAYRKLAGEGQSIVDLLAQPDAEEIDFDPPRLEISLRPADFS